MSSSSTSVPRVASCTLAVSGMDCSSCAESVQKSLRSIDAVQDVQVDVVSGRVVATYVDGEVARGELVGAIERAGYRVKDDAAPTGRAQRTERPFWERRGRLVLTAAAGVLWALSLAAEHAIGQTTLAAALAIASIVVAGRYIMPRGVQAALNKALDMNFLMSVAALGALMIGEYEEAASAMFLFALAQLMESWSMDRARRAITALMDLAPTEATVIRDGAEVRIPADRVAVGETVVVRPGEKIPVDGVILAGASSVNQATITGESMPVDKVAGAEVFAGTLNGEGVLEVSSTKPASDTTLARIIHSVEDAQASRAPSQTFVDRFARVYTPVVVFGAMLGTLFPPLVGLGSFSEWFYRALVLLVVACPCALVISTPVTIVSALAGAARRGILIKGGLHLENAGRARVIALDKTGTLTNGEPEVADVVALNGSETNDVLRIAAATESRSEHPLARAILRRAREEGLHLPDATAHMALTGRGFTARLNGQIAYVGSERLFRGFGELGPEVEALLDNFESAGQTPVLVGTTSLTEQLTGGRPTVRGIIAIADRVRSHAAVALDRLHRAGIERVVVLTGDTAGTARAVRESLAAEGGRIDEVRAELMPQEKVEAIRQLRRRHSRVLMVGDGVNDAPALAAADVGIAMGSAGSDVALETADIALMADDLSKIAITINFARKAERIIRANIAFSLLTKAAFVVLAVAGVATLWMAVVADMGASLLVILNGLRALRA